MAWTKERLAQLERREERLVASLLLNARALDRTRKAAARARRSIMRQEGEAVARTLAVDPVSVECTSCDVGPGAACLWAKGKKPQGLPYHRPRLVLAASLEAKKGGAP